MRLAFLSTMVVCVIAALSGCSDSTSPREPLTIPVQYDSTAWRANAADELLYLEQMGALISELKRARTIGVTLDANTVNGLWLKLERYLSPQDVVKVAERVSAATSASGNTMDPLKAPSENGNGGVFVKYLFDAYGGDVTEHIEKVLFSAALYKHAMASLDTTVPSVRNVDRALALFGASPSFVNSDKALLYADRYCASYAARRDKNDGLGYYTTLRDAFKKARAAAAAGRSYDTEYREAVSTIRTNWERSQMATVVSYCYATITALSATNVDDNARATGMHAFGEALGFVWGWNATPAAQRIISDQLLSQTMVFMGGRDDVEWTFYNVWQQPQIGLNELYNVTFLLQDVYGFTNAEMLDFKQNWVNVQSRL